MGFWEFKGLAGVGSYYGLEIEEKNKIRNYNKLIVSFESPHQPECICFFLNAISSIIDEIRTCNFVCFVKIRSSN